MTFDLTINTQNILSEIVTEDNSVSFEVAIGNLLKGQGYTEKGEWDELTHYMPYDVVHYLNSVYVCLVENEGSLPTNENTDWEMWLDSTEFLNKSEAQVITGIKEFQNGLKVGGDEEIGTFSLNEEDLTIGLSMKDGVELQLGQEFLVPIRNGENDILMNGEIVYTETTIGNSSRLVVKRFLGDGDTGMTTIGMITHDIESGEDGYATILGKVRGIDTRGLNVGETWQDGDLLYTHPTIAGAMTNVLPNAPKTKTCIGRIISAHINGSIFIRPINAMNLHNLSDVDTYNSSTLVNNSVMVWNSADKCWKAVANLDDYILKTNVKQELGDSETDVMSQKAITEAIMKAHDYDINFFAYGVSRDLTGAGTTLTRVGNLSLHKTRPILRKVRGCVKNAQGVQYYLDNNTDYLKADGVTPSVLDGTDGDVMTEIPEMYVYEYTEGNYEYTYLSEFPLPNFKRIPKTYHGRYEGSYDTTTNQLRSVINPNIRGGLPATGQSVFYYNSGAIKDRNLDWSPDRLLSHYVRALLFRVHYATYDSQAPYNSALTPEGYLQGGLGIGVTNINSTKWSKYNGSNPFIPCGYTAELGNKTGVKEFYMPFEYDGYNTTAEDNTQYYKGVYNASTAYNVNELVADMEDSVIGKGDGKLYKCILNAPAGTELTDTAYFTLQTRTKTEANRFLVEIPFGHIWKQTIDAIVELTDNYTTTKCYVYDNPAHFTSTKTANARFLCDMPSAEGYVKLFNKYTIVPYSIGGSSGAWGYDYFYWRGEAGGALRGLRFGGTAAYWSHAGLGCSASNFSPSAAYAYIGVRLCCFLEGSNIE